MKKPTLPSEPTEPKKPEQVIRSRHKGYVRLCDGESLKELLEQINSYFKNWADDHPTIDYSEIKFNRGFSSSYDSSDGEFVFDYQSTNKLSDKEYNKKLADYNNKYKLYREKLESYNKSLAKYKYDLALYEKWRDEENEKKERALLEKLQKKYKE